MRKISLLVIVFFLITLNTSYIAVASGTTKNNSPIVQIVSYKHNFGKFFELKWWGSASIINKNGFLVTNNHVVDDGKGGTLDFFNICISEDETQKPKCNYTATLVTRDTQKDIALLKLNSKDIYGNTLDTTALQTIAPDYNYTPTSGDSVTAVGYPWVGSETITKTQGIISGTSQYNNATYLKTDTLIAGGNSGGALIKDGKLIGIPTFGIGGGTDTSLGYALLISYAKELIESNTSKTIQEDDTISFNEYKKTIEEINNKKLIQDNFAKISFSSEYEVSDYIADRLITLKPSKGNEELPESINLGIAELPTLSSQDDFLYYMQKIGLYSKDYQKLKKITIQGIDFFTPVSSYDSAGGDVSSSKIYFGRLGDKVIIFYGIFSSEQEDKIIKAQSNFDAFISKITFDIEGIKRTSFDFNLTIPGVQISPKPSSVLTESSGFAYIFPFGNLHEHLEFQILPLDITSGKGKSVSSLYNTDTKDISDGLKSMIMFKGHSGYMYCSSISNEYQEVTTDEKGSQLDQSSCHIRIYDFKTKKDEYVLDGILLVDRKNKALGLTTLINFLNENITIPTIGKGETHLVNIFTAQDKIEFTDIQKQPEGFKQKLNLLIKYHLLANGKTFDPYKPIKWGEFMTFYTSRVYKIDYSKYQCKSTEYKCMLKGYRVKVGENTYSLAYLLDKIGIRSDSYVNQDKLDEIPTVLDMIILGGVSPENYSEEDIKNFPTLQNEQFYEELNKKIQEGSYNLYGNKKISLYDIDSSSNFTNFLASKELYYIGSGGLVEQPYYTTGKLNLSTILKPSDFSQYKLYYPVLTKAEMVDFTTDDIDFGLYDNTLSEKKNTSIEN